MNDRQKNPLPKQLHVIQDSRRSQKSSSIIVIVLQGRMHKGWGIVCYFGGMGMAGI